MKDASVEEVLQVSLNGLGVSGVVQPESGIPLAGVTVSIKKIKKLGVTHEVGKFDPKDVPNGEYEVKISYVGLVDESSGRDRG
ncbi:MAG TPA: carboxypeptidase-like regulatory domain-containing protein [Puia sp.]|nr:carboxypeptidase-like regulatory domain-containing protein [Puia sp.]